MSFSWSWTLGRRSRRTVRQLALMAGAALATACVGESTKEPVGITPTTAPQANTVEMSEIPCFENSRACGLYDAVVGRTVANAYVNLTTSELGAWSKTWSPTKEPGYMSLHGKSTVRRGEGRNRREVEYGLGASNYALEEIGDGFESYNTCQSERNEVVGWTRNSVQGGSNSTLAWLGSFTDSDLCEGPPGGDEECEGGGDERREDVDDPYGEEYDPYSGGCGGGDSSGGSGIQYEEGDYTNGETVDWNTGVGNGGKSVCEAKAVVDYICIDTWNESTQQWEEWDCGYATTC